MRTVIFAFIALLLLAGCKKEAIQSGGVSTATPVVVRVPERAILPRLPKFIKLDPGINAALSAPLQRVTTRLAAAILRALHDATRIYLPSVTVEVAVVCAGLQTMMLMLLVAWLIAAVMPARRLPWAFALVVAAALLALEANAFRVAGTAIGLQLRGWVSHEAKDWIHVGTLGLAIAQLAGLGRLIARFTVSQAGAGTAYALVRRLDIRDA